LRELFDFMFVAGQVVTCSGLVCGASLAMRHSGSHEQSDENPAFTGTSLYSYPARIEHVQTAQRSG
jgi:hypothetical protein